MFETIARLLLITIIYSSIKIKNIKNELKEKETNQKQIERASGE